MNERYDDPRLDELIERLRSTPERDPEAIARGRARFLAEMEPLFEPAQAQPLWKRFWKRLWSGMTIQRSKESTTMTTPTKKFAFSSVLALMAVLIMLLGGASATAFAAQSALPGETLYPVKTGLEETQIRLSRNTADQAELHLAFAQRRLDEIAGLIEQGRFDEIQLAAREFEAQVGQAIDALQTVSLGDPLRARELAGQIASSLSSYARTLSGMLSSVPEPVRPVMEQAIHTAQTGDDQALGEQEFSGPIEVLDGPNWIVAGVAFQVNAQTEIKGSFSLGDLVKVHAFSGVDGSLTAREIEPAAGIDDDLNANDNHANDNLNANDDHGNDNDDLDDNSNLNSNDDHDDDNLNSNDDHGNDNLNGNENSGSSSQGGETRFVGVVQSINANTWVVSGISMKITPQTEIRDAIAVGDRIEVRAINGPDGKLIALRLEIDDSGSSGSSSSGSSGSSGSGSSGGGAEDNSNTNSNTNSNDDSSGNLNANSNDNSGDDSGNTNTNSNSNDDSGGSSGSNSNDDSGSGGGSGSGSGGGSGSGDDNSSGHG